MPTLGQIYELAVRSGIEADPRGQEEVERDLARVKSDYEDMKEKEKEEFDLESLANPYADTRILYGEKDLSVEGIIVGIDMEIGEVLLADRLRAQGKKIDLILAHHPEGYALAGFYEVMHMQADVLNKFGVPINVAEGILKDRIEEVGRKVMPVNHARAVDAAKLLDLPFLCVHTPSDNLVTRFLQDYIDKEKPNRVKNLLDLLKGIPEYKQAVKDKAGPKIINGDKENRVGKVFVEMTGGTEGAKESMEKLAQAGVGTMVHMHLSEDHRKEAEKHHLNVIIAGHMASDTIGINLFLDELTKKAELEITPCSGFRRVERR
ncbi:MAG: NGG1p interacting factor NIF3 [bacterium]